ncbi:FAD-dependent oxidoreductase [Marinobacterium sedimentorum]|uniref:FAD-dependent oxidoreductase n=1 Tax=Marinobacterium sedimentorum TaxID=2927804 RepID=UPI0020C664F2|nr:FAD-dependent oxidoreductase [Marinobacterium sedimentorum]MCP8687587.1 FAD-dependent oxidoreductase [Marinobacterium sedimentorum]
MSKLSMSLEDIAENAVFDVAVIGAGGAGMAAALFAAQQGQRVLLVESTEYVGGTTAWSGGTTWIPNTRHAAAVGAQDSREKASLFLDLAVGERSSRVMRDAFLEAGPKAVGVLEDNTEMKFRPRPFHPDYLSELEGATLCGRALEPLPFDGRLLGGDFKLIRPPIPEFTVLGGMMVDRDDIAHLLRLSKSIKSFGYAMKLVLRHLCDRLRYPRGTRLVMGNAMIGRLLYSLRNQGASLLMQTQLETLVQDKGAVVGLALRQGDVTRRVSVSGGVILASGGFARHPQRRTELLPHPTPAYSPAAPGHTGKAHDLALPLGAHYGETNLENAFWAPVSVRKRTDGSTAVFPHFLLDRGKPGMITVNIKGQRFVNESTSYHLFGRAMFQANEETPCIPAYLITDSMGLKKYGLGMVRPGGRGLKPFLQDGYLSCGNTLHELADRLGIDGNGLAQTVSTFNDYAKTGVDADFQRGSTRYERANGDAGHTGPNPCLGALETGPFYAVRLYPGDIGSSAGLVTDTDGRVLGRDNQPIAGLYACGNDMQSIMGGTYPGPGITLGPGITFGYVTALHASKRAAGAQQAPVFETVST